MNIEKIKSWVISHKIISGIIVFILITIIITPTPKQEMKEKVTGEVPTQQVEQKVVFDLPSIVDKNKKEIVNILGKADSDLDDTVEYKKDGYTLFITFEKKSYLPIDFFVSRVGTVEISSKSELAKIANISPDDKSYILTMIKALGTEDKYTGLTIKTKKSVISKWDELIKIGKEAGVIYKDVKEIGGVEAYQVYVDQNWYILKVDLKKDLVTKFSNLKKEITGYANLKMKDSNTDGVIAEYTSFSGVTIYK